MRASPTMIGAGRLSYLLVFLLLLTCVKLVFAGLLPLSGDESLYWLYSKHLAPGFIDHPLINPLMIHIGTTLFGDTSLGVRFMAVLAGLPTTWAVWRSAATLSKDEAVGATAAILFSVTLVATVGSMAATSDALVVLTSAFLLYFVAKLDATGDGRWWLAIGSAFGLGMCSKYTTAFFALSLLAWLVIVPANRRWLLTIWPWAAGLLALAIFSPVILWNANHQWASFGYQAHRMAVAQWSFRYVGELIGSQILLATPPVFVLGCIGLLSGWRREAFSTQVLLSAMVAPIAAYFLWHSLHERVQGNWPEPIYPAFVVAAACAAHRAFRRPAVAVAANWSRRLAAPVGLTLAAASLLQGAFAILPLGKSDPSARELAVGWTELAPKLDDLYEHSGASALVTTDYTLAGWLSFYLPSHPPVVQINERIRWIDAPPPDPALLSGALLYICWNDCPYLDDMKRAFAVVEPVGVLPRERGGVTLNTYSAYRLSRPTRPVLDPVYPPMNMGGRE